MINSHARGEWRNWPALFASTLGVTLATSNAYSLGVMIAPLEQQFGWTRTQITSGQFVAGILGLFLAPVVGVAIDKFGPRRIALVGIPLYCVAFALLSAANGDLLVWRVQWAFLTLATLLVGPMTWTAMTVALFSKHRGLAIAITLSGTGVAALIVPATLHWLLELYGWRSAYIFLSIAAGVLVFPVAYFLFSADGPSAARLGAGTDHGRVDRVNLAGPQRETDFVRLYRSPRFILLAAAATIFVIATAAINLNAVPILVAQGMDATLAAGLAAFLGLGVIVGRLAGGYMIDRLPANRVAAVIVLLPIGTSILFLIAPGQYYPAIIALCLIGFASGAEYDACAYLVAHHFGPENFGKLFGAITGALILGVAIAPMAASYVYDLTKSYDLVLAACIPAGLIASVLFLLVGIKQAR